MLPFLMSLFASLAFASVLQNPCSSFSSCSECLAGASQCGWCPRMQVKGGSPLMNVCLNGTSAGPFSPIPGLTTCPDSIFGRWSFGKDATCPMILVEWSMAGHDVSRTYESSFEAPGRSELALVWETKVDPFFSGYLPVEPVVFDEVISICGKNSLFRVDAKSGKVLLFNKDAQCFQLSVNSVGAITSSNQLDVRTHSPKGDGLYRVGYVSGVTALVRTAVVGIAPTWLSSAAAYLPTKSHVFCLGNGLTTKWMTELEVPYPDASLSPLAFSLDHGLVFGGICDARAPLGYSNETYTFALNALTGKTAWIKRTLGCVAGVATSQNVVVVSGWRNSSVSGLDAATGDLLWEFVLPQNDFSFDPMPVTISRGVVYFGTANGGGCYALQLRTGSLVWHNPAGGSDSPATISGNNLFVVHAGRVAILDALTGSLILKTSIPASTVSIVAPESLLVTNAMAGTLSWFKVK